MSWDGEDRRTRARRTEVRRAADKGGCRHAERRRLRRRFNDQLSTVKRKRRSPADLTTAQREMVASFYQAVIRHENWRWADEEMSGHQRRTARILFQAGLLMNVDGKWALTADGLSVGSKQRVHGALPWEEVRVRQ